MTDIRLVPITALSPEFITLDWLQTPTGLLDETQELASAVTVAVCSDATADASDVLPDPNTNDRRGWWGDLDASLIWGGWPIGSKLWLLKRAKILQAGAREGATTVRVQQYLQACIQPFVAAGICSAYTITATQTSIKEIDATVMIYRGPKTAIKLQFQAVWSELFPLAAANMQ